jgi:hypothetical protein
MVGGSSVYSKSWTLMKLLHVWPSVSSLPDTMEEHTEGEAEDCPVLHGNLSCSFNVEELVIFVVLNFGTAAVSRLLIFRKQLGWQLFSHRSLNSKQIGLLAFSFFRSSVS